MSVDRAWIQQAIQAIHADFHRSADTHLLRFTLGRSLTETGLALYLKDESTHPTGSLKHRLARSLFLYALCNGKITGPDTIVYEASSGSTAISEAYFAHLIGLKRFCAVVPRTTSEAKLHLIEDYGGEVHLSDADVIAEATRLAAENDGCFLDQFTFSERATDWRGNNNIAETIFEQLQREPPQYRSPAWIVCGAGTGGTSATIGRFARYRGFDTRICVVDPPESVYFDCWGGAFGRARPSGERRTLLSLIEGIGRPVAAASFLPEVIDAMVSVPNDASIAAMRYLHSIGRCHCGVSTGTNFIGACLILSRMQRRKQRGAVITLLCDSGLRYATTYSDPRWLAQQRFPDGKPVYDEARIGRFMEAIQRFVEQGEPIEEGLMADGVYADFIDAE